MKKTNRNSTHNHETNRRLLTRASLKAATGGHDIGCKDFPKLPHCNKPV